MSSRFHLKDLIQAHNHITRRSYYYNSKAEEPTLYSKISPLGDPTRSLLPELDDWVKNGNRVRVAELHRIVRDFRKRKRFSQALEVSEWMHKTEICLFSPVEHAVQLDLIGRVLGFVLAEEYFDKLRDQDKTEKTYGALLNCYVRQRQREKSISHFLKMKQLGFASGALTYNDIMCLYTNIGELDKVPSVLAEMKEDNVSPDNFSYRICINSYGARSDIEGMENILREMEEQPGMVVDWNTYSVVANFYIKAGLVGKAINALRKTEERLKKNDGIGYNHLITLYTALGNKSEVLRLWDLRKGACERYINRDYTAMLESLVKLGEHEEAMEVLKKWEASGNCYDTRIPNIIVVGYCKSGSYDKAEALLRHLINNGRATTPNSWATVAAGYLHKCEMMKAFDCMRTALRLYVKEKGWKPNPRVVSDILNWLGDKGRPEDVESFVSVLKTVIPVDRQMYHALLKASLRSGKEVNTLLDSMKADGIDENEETKKILGVV